MNKFAAIFYDSFLEIKDRKIFYFIFGISAILMIIFALIPNSLQINGQKVMESGLVSPDMVREVISGFFGQYFGFVLFLLVFASAGLMPHYLSKGRVEIVLSKPIHRMSLISQKFISVFIWMCIIFVIATLSIWLTMVIRLGVFDAGFLAGMAYGFLEFLVIYVIVFAFGVLTNSTAVAIIGYFVIKVVTDMLTGRKVLEALLGDSVWMDIINGLYHVLPKTGEMARQYGYLMEGRGIIDYYPIWSSLVFAAVVYGLILLYQSRKDY